MHFIHTQHIKPTSEKKSPTSARLYIFHNEQAHPILSHIFGIKKNSKSK